MSYFLLCPVFGPFKPQSITKLKSQRLILAYWNRLTFSTGVKYSGLNAVHLK